MSGKREPKAQYVSGWDDGPEVFIARCGDLEVCAKALTLEQARGICIRHPSRRIYRLVLVRNRRAPAKARKPRVK